MRILLLSPVAIIGGAERVLLQCLTALQKQGIEASLLAFEEKGPLLDQARKLGHSAIGLPLPNGLTGWGESDKRSNSLWRNWCKFLVHGVTCLPGLYRFRNQLCQAIRDARPDIIHASGIKTHLLAGVARSPRVPIVWHVHDFYGSRPLTAQLLRGIRRSARAAIAISRAVAVDLKRVLPGLRTHVVSNTIDVEQFSPGEVSGAELDRLAGLPSLPEGSFRVGLVATYALWKGHHVFLKAAQEFFQRPRSTPARWYIIGGPIYRTRSQLSLAELQTAAQDLGLGDHVGFIPFQSNPATIYRSLDVVVHASTLPEPFGLTIAEAMACGRPVVVSNAGGASELFVPDVEALGVKPGDVPGLSRAVGRLYDDPNLRHQLGVAARERALRDFHPARLGDQLEAVYRSCLMVRES